MNKLTKQQILIFIGTFIAIIIPVFVSSQSSNESQEEVESKDLITTVVTVPEGQEVATFAGGCFWCNEAILQETEGVVEVISGYAGGQEENPTYEDVYSDRTGHRESVQVFFDPEVISYEEVLDVFWRTIDPTDDGGQFVDRGFSYTTAIFYHNEEQKKIAEESKAALLELDEFDEIVTPVIEFTTFYEAEAYHQDFYLKSEDRYKNYSDNSGRLEFKEQVWEEIVQERK